MTVNFEAPRRFGPPSWLHAIHAGSALWWALGANLVFLFAEIIGDIVFGSLALLADAAHMLSDVIGLVIAQVAQRLLDRPATSRLSFGLQRAGGAGQRDNAGGGGNLGRLRSSWKAGRTR